ncbi:MAG: YihY/virulence factor BrkB family protein [Bacteroidales bacterium]|nr:YihY/virulence factor BrkB family protein [Bacteroidales bacterium]MDD4216010.1 YihY/virulence factor BrkB family protein [Bacteroidales bacterium]MDY0140299.1 YihY/virulence factor BrkB family protein [Bacteroidales bacterium]
MIKFVKKQKQRLEKFVVKLSKKIILPGFRGYSLYYVGSFFFKGIQEGAVSMRASSVAFNLFIAIFPALIFFFSLIPFIPVQNFQYELFSILAEVLPDSAYSLLHETISDTILNQRSSILSIGFFLMLFFASNGVLSFIEAFNNSYHHVDSRNWISKRLISVLLIVIVSVLLLLAISLIVVGNNYFLNFMGDHQFQQKYSSALFFVIGVFKWILVIGLYFLAISFLYFLAPAKKSRFRFITPGAIFATVLQVISSLGFAYYVNNFARYNKLYGSIGTIIVVMLLFYITALALIIGFELNASIFSSNKKFSIKRLKK